MKHEDGYWGNCPICHLTDGFLHIGRADVCACHEHKLAWVIGDNLFSGWRDETEEDWESDRRLLSYYRIIEEEEIWYPHKQVAEDLLREFKGTYPWKDAEKGRPTRG